MRRLAAFVVCLSLALAASSTARAAPPGLAVVMPTVDDMLRNVALDGVMNVRDLGGLRGSRGIIPHERFYRSATLAHATRADLDLLAARGVTLDIDLRTTLETDVKGDRLEGDRRFSYLHISLLGVGIDDWFRGLRALYLHTLGGHEGSMREVFHAMATHGDGAVLYHCTSGKDRTGMITAILLDLAGVARDTIIRDYAISAHYDGRGPDASPPSYIAAFLDALHARFGGAHAYLEHIGLPEPEIHALLVKLGQA